VRRMRKIYSERRKVFIEQFNKLLGDRFTLEIADAGLHALAWFRSEKDLPFLQRAGPKLGVKISPLSFFCIAAKLPPALVLGFAAWSPAQIRDGLVRLARALEKQPVPGNCRSAFRNGKSPR
jgi:GntR family transcriptional regulator / MocR family aminotransferase